MIPQSDSDLRSQTVDAFKRYMEVWEFSDYWTRSNTFEAAIQFVTAARTRWPHDPGVTKWVQNIDKVILGNITYFQDVLTNIDKIWADDFGWCGNACLSAREYILQFPSTDQIAKSSGAFLEIADQCWNNMVNIGYDNAAKPAAPVPHGCFNRSKVSDGHTPMKNTVTNAVFFLLCSRLYQATRSGQFKGFDPAAYLAKSTAQYQWFDAWFNSSYAYLQPPVAPITCALIGERPKTGPEYPDYDNTYMWQPGLVWTGDQGLMLAALTEYAAIDPQAAPAVQNVIDLVVKGLVNLVFDADKIVHEPPFQCLFTGDGKDYVCGRGVLLRHLSSAAVRARINHDFTANVTATNSGAWASRDTTNNQYGAYWNKLQDKTFAAAFLSAWGYGDGSVTWTYDPKYVPKVTNGILQAAGLDALTAAIRMSPADPEPVILQDASGARG
jgi:hypothetical protein